jgi:hypothetical protein
VVYIAWNQFVKAIYANYETDIHYLERMTKLHQIGTMEDFRVAFKKLAIFIESVTDSFSKESFIIGLKEIRTQVLMDHQATWLDASQQAHKA